MTVGQNLRNFLRNLNFCYSQEMVKLEVRLAKSSSENLERYSSRKRSYNEIMTEFVFIYRTYCLMAVYNYYYWVRSNVSLRPWLPQIGNGMWFAREQLFLFRARCILWHPKNSCERDYKKCWDRQLFIKRLNSVEILCHRYGIVFERQALRSFFLSSNESQRCQQNHERHRMDGCFLLNDVLRCSFPFRCS